MRRWILPLVLARRELRGGLKGFRVFLACLILGVAAIAAVQSVSRGVTEGLRADGRAILGGDVALRTLYTPATPEQVRWLAGQGRLDLTVEMRAMARAGADGGRTTLVELKAVRPSYPLYGEVELEGGGALHPALAPRQGPDGRVWGAVVDPVLGGRLGLGIGDTFRIGEAAFQVVAVVAREPDRAGSSGFPLGPRVMVADEALAATELVRTGSLVNWVYRLALPAGVTPAEFRAAVAAALPDANWRIRDYTNAAPQLEQFIGRLALFLTLVGLTSLLVGGVGVGNAVRAYLDGKVRTIAMLKCVGAEGALVFRTYLVQVLVLAGVGIAAGLVVGALVPLLASQALDGLLPVRLRIGIYPGPLLVAAGFGLLTALAFSLWPLGRAREVPAAALFRETVQPARGRPRLVYVLGAGASALGLALLAIGTADTPGFAAAFVAGAVATLLVFRAAAWGVETLAARVGRPRSPGLRLAVANLHRPGNPTGSVVLSLGLGLTVLVAVALIEGNFARSLRETIPDQAPAFFFVDIQPNQREAFRDTVLSVPGTSNLAEVPSLRGRIAQVNGRDAESAIVDPSEAWVVRGDRGVTYAASLPEGSDVIAGQWWPADHRGAPLLSIAEDVAQAFGIGPGARITLNILGRNITAEVANVRRVRWTTLSINFALILSPGVLDRAPQTFLATVQATPQAEPEVQRRVAERFANITMVRVKDALDTVNKMLSDIGTAVRATAAVTLLAGALVLAGAVAAGHSRRVWDAVVLKVLGATRADVLKAFLLEYGLLGLVTAAIAGAVGTLTGWAVTVFVMDQPWTFLPSAVVMTTVLCTAITLGFGFVGTWRALGQPAAPLLRND
ncbi:MAG TPA: FtsX-like permease family protein [Azospirillaceae bacterium]|nr:FtsX-like permease family protein [Azospirillaceae bacterium]